MVPPVGCLTMTDYLEQSAGWARQPATPPVPAVRVQAEWKLVDTTHVHEDGLVGLYRNHPTLHLHMEQHTSRLLSGWSDQGGNLWEIAAGVLKEFHQDRDGLHLVDCAGAVWFSPDAFVHEWKLVEIS